MPLTSQFFGSRLNRAFLGLLLVVCVLAACFQAIGGSDDPTETISISQVIADAQKGKIARIETQYPDSHDLNVTYKDRPRRSVYARVESNESILTLLTANHVALDSLTIVAAPPSMNEGLPNWTGIAIFVSLFVIMLVFQVFNIRQIRRQIALGKPDESVKE